MATPEDDVRFELGRLLRSMPERKRPNVSSSDVYSVLGTKRLNCLPASVIAAIIINRCEARDRRLSHETGAENWL